MRREYIAYVEGRPSTAKGTWRHWLRLSPDGQRQEVFLGPAAKTHPAGAVEAVTHYEVIAEFPVLSSQQLVSKLRLKLETGCKHQIRIQAAAVGSPLIGDRTYNPRYQRDQIKNDRVEFPRQALHAQLLELEHPDWPGKELSWTSELPNDLRKLETQLRSLASRGEL
jgi:23S rRNA pseudouridine1911/1915/1917 synthase